MAYLKEGIFWLVSPMKSFTVHGSQITEIQRARRVDGRLTLNRNGSHLKHFRPESKISLLCGKSFLL
jgi:hypothetical protein